MTFLHLQTIFNPIILIKFKFHSKVKSCYNMIQVVCAIILSVKPNKEHQKEVDEFCNSQVFEFRKKEPHSSINNFVRSPLFFVAFIAVVINFIFFYPVGYSSNNNG